MPVESLSDKKGYRVTTLNVKSAIFNKENLDYSKAVTGVAYSKDDAKITLQAVEDKPGVAAEIFEPFGPVKLLKRFNHFQLKFFQLKGVLPQQTWPQTWPPQLQGEGGLKFWR